MPIATFYPDANPETTSVDGWAGTSNNSVDWATLVAVAGSDSSDVGTINSLQIASAITNNNWNILNRLFFLFDTSTLPDDAVVTAATLSIYGYQKQDNLNIIPDLNVYAATPASNTAIINADFTQVGATAFCDTPITYAGFNTSGWNDFALNATGLTAISLTGVSKFSIRNANYDVSGTPPTWSSNQLSFFQVYFSDVGSNKPKLTVTYISAFKPRIIFI